MSHINVTNFDNDVELLPPTYLLSKDRIPKADFQNKLIIAPAIDNAFPVLGTIQYIESCQITLLYHW
jgi:hypothetical protein